MPFGFWEILIIFVIILIIFGPKKLPQLARSLGKAVGEFKKGQEDVASPKKKKKAG